MKDAAIPLLIRQISAPDSLDARRKLIEAFANGDADDQEIASLAQVLADSGDHIIARGGAVADLASTGGPTSLSTLLCPLMLWGDGFKVPKIGVPGRPAGGIDVMAQLPSFQINPPPQNLEHILDTVGYFHIVGGYKYAPLDAALFTLRREMSRLNVPALAIASLCSKKLAAGITTIGLDVRVAPHGNFGSTWHEARANARRFVQIASSLGITAKCFLTDATIPFQPYIGRTESLVALACIFRGDESPWLANHRRLCEDMVSSISPTRTPPFESSHLRSLWCKHLESQGSSYDEFQEVVSKTAKQETKHITAHQDGILRVDIDRLRTIVVAEQDKYRTDFHIFPDPVGITLEVQTGTMVLKGQSLACLRLTNLVDDSFEPTLSQAFIISSEPSPEPNPMEVISA